MAEVPGVPMTFTFRVCRWCGCPWYFPSEMANNTALTIRCPNGHRWHDGTTVEDRLRECARAGDERSGQITQLRATVASLKGQVTKLRGKR